VSRESRDLSFILLLTIILRIAAALPLERPGYMDAYYYYDGAESLYLGMGFNDQFLWNYLDEPSSIPHPSHLYWMPLPSVLAWVAFLFLGPGYRAAQVPFVLLSSLLPPLTYILARRLSLSRRRGLLAALLVTFSGFYVPYWASPDSFAPFALTGCLALMAMGEGLERKEARWFALAGALTGLSHLSRADAPLLLASLALLLVFEAPRIGLRRFLCFLALALACYLLVMAPWFYRNWRVTGFPLPGAGLKTAFLREYDDLFSYGKELSWRSLLAWGMANILRSRLRAAWLNLQIIVAVLLYVFLAPVAVVGLWRCRSKMRPALAYGALLYLTMSLVFAFPGPRGSLFHSGGALLPFLCVAAVEGLEVAVHWGSRRRGWPLEEARGAFGVGMVALAAFLSLFVYWRAVFWASPPWNERDAIYAEAASWLDDNAPEGAKVAVNNPPAFYYFAHRPCLVIPNGDVQVLLKVCDRYGAQFVLLEENHPRFLEALFRGEESHPRLLLLRTFDSARLYRVLPPG